LGPRRPGDVHASGTDRETKFSVKAHIAVLPGDGVGPEVVAQGVRVLGAIAERFGHTFDCTQALIGGAALDACGTALPTDTLAIAKSSDAILLGAVGGPKWDNPDAPQRPEMGLLGLRKALELYANLRPVTVQPSLLAASPIRPERLTGVDILVVRELTGGLYFGPQGRDGDRAFDTCVYTTAEVERVVRRAARIARTRRGRLTSVDKANVLMTSRLWRNVVARLAREEFPDLMVEHVLVDACAMHLIRRPADFDVLVTENMFGDILSDEASMLAGSLGLLPSASLGAGRRGIYEPIHGSAPDIAGRGIANPCGTLLSVALLLRHSLGLDAEAQALEAAVYQALEEGARTADIAARGTRALSTEEAGAAVLSRLTRRG
jgi:3-isopropylmalate dehydrogenase